MPKLNVSLTFAGRCEDAFNFYKSVFGGEFIFLVRYSTIKDANIPKEDGNKIANIALRIGPDILSGSDMPDLYGVKVAYGNGVAITVHPESKEDADRIFNSLSAGGVIRIPIADQAWGDYFGSFTDRFGVDWRVLCINRKSSTQARVGMEGADVIENRDMTGTIFHNINMSKVVFDDVYLDSATFRNCFIRNMAIEGGFIEGLTIRGLRVDRLADLIEAEMGGCDPVRSRLRMTDIFDPAEIMRVIEVLDRLRTEFCAELRAAPHEKIIAHPPGLDRWSALEHTRHLLGSEDGYLNRLLLSNDKPPCKLGMLPPFMLGNPAFAEVGSGPVEDLEAVLAAWDEIHSEMKIFLSGITVEILKREVSDPQKKTVGNTLQILALHELEHIRMAQAAIADVEKIK